MSDATVDLPTFVERTSKPLAWDTLVCTGCLHIGAPPPTPPFISCCPEREPVTLRGLVDGFGRAEMAEADLAEAETLHGETLLGLDDANLQIEAVETQRDALAAALRLTHGRTVVGLLRSAAGGSQAHAPTYLDAADRIEAAMAALESPSGRQLDPKPAWPAYADGCANPTCAWVGKDFDDRHRCPVPFERCGAAKDPATFEAVKDSANG